MNTVPYLHTRYYLNTTYSFVAKQKKLTVPCTTQILKNENFHITLEDNLMVQSYLKYTDEF